MSFLLDAPVLAELTTPGPEPAVLAWLGAQDQNTLFLSAVTLGEFRYALEALPVGAKRMRLQRNLDTLHQRFASRILAFDAEAADAWGRLRRRAARAGRDIAVLDAMLAATAEVRGLALVTRSLRSFEGWGGPVVSPWPQPSVA